MSTSSDLESSGTERLAFDCPWCGAMLKVDAEHLGTSYPCPECGESTKLTEGNTRQGHLADVSVEGAPREKKKRKRKRHAWESYEKGHVTFDCPWCGAIYGLDPSHLGERFECAECRKETKLTEATTRKSDVAQADPDAPPHQKSRSLLALVVGAVVVVLVAVVAIVVVAGSGGGADEESATSVSETPRFDAPTPASPPEPEPGEPPADAATGPEGVPADTAPAEDPPPADEETNPEEAAPDPAPEPPVEEGPSEIELAEAALAEAVKALEDWRGMNADAAECLALSGACGEVCDSTQRLLGDLDPASASVAEARAYNEAMHRFVLESPDRVAVADRLTRRLVSEPLAPLRLRSWESLNFFEPRVRETLRYLHAVMLEVDTSEHDALLEAVAAAKEAVALARAAAEAEARAEEPEAPAGD